MHEVKKAFTFGLANDNGRLVVVDFNDARCVHIECDISGLDLTGALELNNDLWI